MAKEAIREKFKGTFVKNEEQARKFLAKHKAEFILREVKEEIPELTNTENKGWNT